MDITKLIGNKKTAELFVSFVIVKDWIQAGLWSSVENQEGTLLSYGMASPWQENVPKDATGAFVDAADDSLSSAIGALGTNTQPPQLSRVVFGLSPSWIENGKVHTERLGLLRELCEKLELTPSGFVVIPEALIYMIRQKEGGAGSFILVGLDEEEIELTLVQAGKVADCQRVARSIALGDDITEGLTRINSQEVMPARVILYNRHTGQLTDAKQELLSWEWSQKIFLHTPRIEILPADSLIASVSEAAAMEVAHVNIFKIAEKEPESDEIIDQEQFNKSQLQNEEPLVDAQTLGFHQETQEEPEEPQEKSSDDIQPIDQPTDSQVEEVNRMLLDEEESNFILPKKKIETEQDEQKPHTQKLQKLTTFPITQVNTALSHLPKPPVLRNSKLRTIILILFLTAVAFGATLWYIPKAAVSIYVTPKRLDQSIPLVITAGSETDGKIAGKTIATDVSGEKTTSTSGKKTVGDKSKGQISIRNNTTLAKTFPSGTVLVGPNSLKFMLDQDIKVASSSGAPDYIPGSTQTGVTAVDIGTQYNLAPGAVFSVANFSTNSYSATNSTAFSGGTSQEVAAVAKNDQEKLEKDLNDELKSKAMDALNSQVGTSDMLIPDSVKITVANKKFSTKIGDQADTLGLSLSVHVSFLTVPKQKLFDRIKEVLTSKVPQGFALQSDRIGVTFVENTTKKDQQSDDHPYNAQVSAFLIPAINTKDLAKNIAGKTPNSAKTTFLELSGFTRSTIKFSPNIPFLPGMLGRIPKRIQNITIELKAEQ